MDSEEKEIEKIVKIVESVLDSEVAFDTYDEDEYNDFISKLRKGLMLGL